MALNNPLATVIKALSQQKRVEPKEEEQKEKTLKKSREILTRLKDMQKWQRKADKQLLGLNLVVQKLATEEKPNSIKETLDKINARLAPRTFNLGEQGQFQYDPLAPEGKQVTKLSSKGKASVGATKKDIEVVLKKAAFIFNQEVEKLNTVAKKEKKPSRTKKASVRAKMMKSVVDQPEKKDFTETYKKLAYEMEEDDPVYLLKKSVDKNFAKVFKQLKEIRALVISNSGGLGGLNPLDLLGKGRGKGAKPGRSAGRFGGMGKGLAGAASGLLVGGGLAAYNSLRQFDPNRDKGDVGIDAAVNTAGAAYFGSRAVKSVQEARKTAAAASRLSRMRKVNPDVFKGTAKQRGVWTKFLKYLAKKSPRLAARLGTKLAAAAGLAAVPVIGWLGAAANIGMAAWTMYEIYDLWKEYNALSEEEKTQYENAEGSEPADQKMNKQLASNTNNVSAAEKLNQQRRGSRGGRGAPAARPGAAPEVAVGSVAATGQELKGVSESGSAKEAMKFFQDRGWTKEQSAGIVANLMAESGASMKTDASGDNGHAYGIAQWQEYRQQVYEKTFGKPIRKAGFQEQLEYVNWELNHTEKQAGDALRQTKDAATAAAVVDAYYERSAGLHRQKRIDYANQLLDEKYLNKVATQRPRGTTTTPAATTLAATATPATNPTGTATGTINRGTPAAATTPPQQPVNKVAAKDWAWSVYSNQATLQQVPAIYKNEVNTILANPPANWKDEKAKITSTPVENVTAPEDVTITDKPLPRDESTYAMQQLGMMNDQPVPVAPNQTSVTNNATNSTSVTPVTNNNSVAPVTNNATNSTSVTPVTNNNSVNPRTATTNNVSNATTVAPAVRVPIPPVGSDTNNVTNNTTNNSDKVLNTIQRVANRFSPRVATGIQTVRSVLEQIKPTQKIAGETLAQNSVELESNKTAAAMVPPVIIQQTAGGGGGGCRFVPSPPAPLPAVDIKNADASIKSAFSRDRWA
jgi:hypothetical protein